MRATRAAPSSGLFQLWCTERHARLWIWLAVFVCVTLTLLLGAQADVVFVDADVPAHVQNPGTGFVGWAGSTSSRGFASSLEFVTLPLASVYVDGDRISFAALEAELARVAATDRQAVVRFYIDNPAKASGVPVHLLREGLRTRVYTENGNCVGDHHCSVIPDYGDARLHAALLRFVAAFGRAHDGDPRIFTVQVGLVGFWGEWHTWPLEYTAFTFPPDAFLRQLLDAYTESFARTLVQVGINVAALPLFNAAEYRADVQRWRVGFSDDSLLRSDYESFVGPILRASNTTGKHAISSIGGEIFPPKQACAFAANSCVSDARLAFAQWHVSWALFARIFQQRATRAERAAANTAAKAMGYRLSALRASVVFRDDGTDFNVTVRNSGVARFYYRLVLAVRHSEFVVVLEERLDLLRPGETRWYAAAGPAVQTRRPDLPERFALYMYSRDLLPTQRVYFSNAGINKDGELPFVY